MATQAAQEEGPGAFLALLPLPLPLLRYFKVKRKK